MEKSQKDNSFYFLTSKDTLFLIIRDLNFKQEDIDKRNKGNIKEEKEFLTFVFDFDNLSKELNKKEGSYYNFREIIYNNAFINKNIENKTLGNKEKNKHEHLNIVIKNCLVNNGNNLYFDYDLVLNKLIVSDELYSMSPYIDELFQKFKPKILILKKMKFNSKLQLEIFLKFIKNTGWEELTLDDIFIELLIKKDENDETYNMLENYITFEEGKVLFFLDGEKKETKIKKLKLIDCPLFAIQEKTFLNINKYKDISIDIDENSLINPLMITKFKIIDGFSHICFDLDLYKIYEGEEEKDYIYYLKTIFNMIINNNYNMKKIIFKNFDVTKYEYITGENLTFIDEINWILNNAEKKRKKDYEDTEKDINIKINKNIDKLSEVRELTFENCTNSFIQLIFKFINSKALDFLKIKKCGKDYFDLKNISSFTIKSLILFDTPLINDKFPQRNDSHLTNFQGKIENLTIKISSLEHYCVANNLDYFRTLEIIVELISKENCNENLCFEMNALPIIMTFLVTKRYNKDNKDIKGEDRYIMHTYFIFTESLKRDDLIKKTFNLNVLKDKKITLKKNNIKNYYDNYDHLTSPSNKEVVKLEKGKDQKTDFGSDLVNLDEDFKQFFQLNKIKKIIFENCLFTNFTFQKLPTEETIINLMKDKNDNKEYSFDMKSINEVIYRNRGMEDIQSLFKFLSIKNFDKLSTEVFDYCKNIEYFFKYLKKIFDSFKNKNITIRFKNIKERKQFYWLLCILSCAKNENDYESYSTEDKTKNLKLPNSEIIKKKLENYFLKEKNENNDDILSIYNYYYTSEEEKQIFNKNPINFGEYTFNIEYEYDKNNSWNDFVYE